MTKKLYVGNCSFNLGDEDLKTFAESQGLAVESVRIIRDRDTNRSKGFGFIELKEDQDVDQAIEALNGQEVEGRQLRVDKAREQQPRRNNHRGGGGGGGGNRW